MMYSDLINLRLPVYLLKECLALEEQVQRWKELATKHYEKHNSTFSLSRLLIAVYMYKNRDPYEWLSELEKLCEEETEEIRFNVRYRLYWTLKSYVIAFSNGSFYDTIVTMDNAFLYVLEMSPHIPQEKIAEVLINAFEEEKQ